MNYTVLSMSTGNNSTAVEKDVDSTGAERTEGRKNGPANADCYIGQVQHTE
jgi:hypothetical protein